MRLYLAGPMTGIPNWNYPAFERATQALRAAGYTVVSPHELDRQMDHDPNVDGHLGYREYMKQDLPAVLESDAVAVLPGWAASKGARLEVHVAEQCGVPVYPVEFLLDAKLEPERTFVAA